jgi:hypothetical protein
MKKLFLFTLFAIVAIAFNARNKGDAGTKTQKENITFYDVPLVCGAAPDIGCGSRIKPLFIDTEKEKQIRESWANRQGTVIAIVWNETAGKQQENEKLIQSLFTKHDIDAKLISDASKIKDLTTGFQGKEKWYKGMDVDLLSIEEAGVIAESATKFAKDEGLINEQEKSAIRKDIEEYFKKELTQVRTYDNLKSEDTQEKWQMDSYRIYVNHIGKERADKVSEFYVEYQAKKKECKSNNKSCCDKDESK